jgi:hypothetical protein
MNVHMYTYTTTHTYINLSVSPISSTSRPHVLSSSTPPQARLNLAWAQTAVQREKVANR